MRRDKIRFQYVHAFHTSIRNVLYVKLRMKLRIALTTGLDTESYNSSTRFWYLLSWIVTLLIFAQIDWFQKCVLFRSHLTLSDVSQVIMCVPKFANVFLGGARQNCIAHGCEDFFFRIFRQHRRAMCVFFALVSFSGFELFFQQIFLSLLF